MFLDQRSRDHLGNEIDKRRERGLWGFWKQVEVTYYMFTFSLFYRRLEVT